MSECRYIDHEYLCEKEELKAQLAAQAAEIATLRDFINAPPAQMSYNGRLVTIDSMGMREVVDEATALRVEVERLDGLAGDRKQMWREKCEEVERLKHAAQFREHEMLQAVENLAPFLAVAKAAQVHIKWCDGEKDHDLEAALGQCPINTP